MTHNLNLSYLLSDTTQIQWKVSAPIACAILPLDPPPRFLTIPLHQALAFLVAYVLFVVDCLHARLKSFF